MVPAHRGRLTVTQLVDRYPIHHQGVRRLLIDYLTRRRAGTGYTTITALARQLANTFWAKIEKINPGQQDLALSPEVYDQWREAIKPWDRDESRTRADDSGILLAVRALHLDLHSWAIDEPEQWAQWVVPCPIRPKELKGFAKRKPEIHQRMSDRIRVRQPLLPTLVAHVEGRYEPVWWTRRGPIRRLTYHGAHRMFERVNASLGADWTLHDLRHSAAARRVRDPKLTLSDVQWVLGHAHLSATEVYLTPHKDEVVAGVLAHHARQAREDIQPAPPPPAPGYDPASLDVLFGRSS
ncbi:hypothetical protein [Streptomyces tendae]|uniref:hypothetical protein n=1 Tax=Streptomyces tendae TaxID=1932 RepID=UPI0036F89A39